MWEYTKGGLYIFFTSSPLSVLDSHQTQVQPILAFDGIIIYSRSPLGNSNGLLILRVFPASGVAPSIIAPQRRTMSGQRHKEVKPRSDTLGALFWAIHASYRVLHGMFY